MHSNSYFNYFYDLLSDLKKRFSIDVPLSHKISDKKELENVFKIIRNETYDYDSRLLEHKTFQFIVNFCNKYELDKRILSDDEILELLKQLKTENNSTNYNFTIFEFSVLFETYYICISNYEHRNFIQNIRKMIILSDFCCYETYGTFDLENFGLFISWNRIKDHLNDAFDNLLFYNNELIY